jgi:hypothetical protein
MTIRLVTLLAGIIAISSACSSEQRQSVVTNSPTAVIAGASAPLVAYPGRADTVEFRTQLENKYRAMGRSTIETVVDGEGEAAWVGEYHRYRVNGCDHNTATQYALAQIDGAAPAPVCSLRQFPETAQYPPHDHLVDFRRQLGAKYQAMGRTAQSAVDPDGAAIWIGEYLRYRSSGCDHTTAVNNVMTQIDGQPAPPTCTTACAYFVETPTAVSGDGGTFTAHLRRTSGTCEPWVAQSEAPWITLSAPITGGDRSLQTYTVAANNTGGQRSGWIRFTYAGGISYMEVTQGTPSDVARFDFFDPATSSTPTVECRIRTNATVCTLTAVSATTSPAIATYDWRVEYTYNGTKVRTQTGPLPSFSFTESCGTTTSGTGGVVPITVRLIASDSTGKTRTFYSGQGEQLPLQLRIFPCQ